VILIIVYFMTTVQISIIALIYGYQSTRAWLHAYCARPKHPLFPYFWLKRGWVVLLVNRFCLSPIARHHQIRILRFCIANVCFYLNFHRVACTQRKKDNWTRCSKNRETFQNHKVLHYRDLWGKFLASLCSMCCQITADVSFTKLILLAILYFP